MSTTEKPVVTIKATIHAPVEKVWELWNTADHVTKWNNASPDWHTPKAENDFREGGAFVYRMEAKDGSFGFDFGGVYDRVKELEEVAYTLGDGRKVAIRFKADGAYTHIVENFEAEGMNPVEMQQQGWQSILDNFKKYAEAQ